MKYKNLSLDLVPLEPQELKDENQPWIVEGYASTYDIDLGGDLIKRGAFELTLKDRFFNKKKSKIKVLWQHNPELIIRKILRY